MNNMYQFKNKTTTIAKDQESFATYGDLLTVVLSKQPVQKAITVAEIRRDLKLLDQLEKAPEYITVNTDDHIYLTKLVEESEWGIKHKDIVDFADDVANAELVHEEVEQPKRKLTVKK